MVQPGAGHPPPCQLRGTRGVLRWLGASQGTVTPWARGPVSDEHCLPPALPCGPRKPGATREPWGVRSRQGAVRTTRASSPAGGARARLRPGPRGTTSTPVTCLGQLGPTPAPPDRPRGAFDPPPPPELFSPTPAAVSCPRNLDCILMRREFCPPGSGACGPCLPTFQEDADGRCVQKQISARGRCTRPSAAPSAPPARSPARSPLPSSALLSLLCFLLPAQPRHREAAARPLSPQLRGAWGAGSRPDPPSAHPPAAALVATSATGPQQHPGVPRARRGPGWLLGCSRVCLTALGWGLSRGGDVAVRSPRLRRSRDVALGDSRRPCGRGTRVPVASPTHGAAPWSCSGFQ